jgi:NADH-quinone oxidoreductase subunit M
LNNVAHDIPLLTAIVLVPVIGALIVSLLPRHNSTAVRSVGMATAVLTFGLSIVLLLAFDRHDGNYQFVSQHRWFEQFGISWKLGVDGISLFLVVLTGLIFPLTFIGAGENSKVKAFTAWMLLLEAGCLASFLALDLFLFFVAFEAVLVPSYFLIAGWGLARRRFAAMKFFIYTFAGSAFLLIALIALVFISADRSNTNVTFDLVTLAQQQAFTGTQARWLFFGFAIAFVVKAPLFPLHTWIGDTYQNAPISAVVISTVVMAKIGTYGLIRFGVELFPEAAYDMAPVFLTLALIGMIYGAMIAAVSKDLRRVGAYSSIVHLGFIAMGTFAFSSEGMTGAVLQMINHGIIAGAMFLIFGFIYMRTQTTDVSQLSGLQKVAPVMAAFFTVTAMASIGVPGLNGFIGEFLVLSGTFITHRWWAVVGTATVVLAAVYLLWAYQQVFHGEPNEKTIKVVDLTTRERLVIVPLLALMVFIGVYPKPVLERIEPSVDRVLQATPGYQEFAPANVPEIEFEQPGISGQSLEGAGH